MALDVKNTDGAGGGDTGNTKNGTITVKGNRNNAQQQDAAGGNQLYSIPKFDLSANVTSDPEDGAKLQDRFDDPRYYQGDLVT